LVTDVDVNILFLSRCYATHQQATDVGKGNITAVVVYSDQSTAFSMPIEIVPNPDFFPAATLQFPHL
jgi:hypothetical protein